MKALVVQEDSNTQNLQSVDISIPNLNDNEILIEVKAVSLNPVDYKVIDNKIIDVNYPYIPCIDVSGVVVNSNNSKFENGDRVAVSKNPLLGGGLCEYTKANQDAVYHIPDNIDFFYGAASACAGLTAYQGLCRKVNLLKSSSILIQGGGGGVGSFAILIAKKLGHKVFATSSAEKKDYIESLGAVHIDYKKDRLLEDIFELNEKKVDMVFELVSKENIKNDLEVLDFNGAVCTIVGFDKLKPIDWLTYSSVILGFAYAVDSKKHIKDLSFMGQELLELLGDDIKKINLQIFKRENISKAFELLKTSRTKGKIVIDYS